MTDWIGDPNLSLEEKLARFEALEPVPTRGPRELAVHWAGTPMAITGWSQSVANNHVECRQQIVARIEVANSGMPGTGAASTREGTLATR